MSGTSQSDSNATTQEIYRLGFVAYINHLKSLMGSGKSVTGNVADWGGTGAGPADIAQYEGVLAGGVMESIIGQSYSYEAWQGWAAMMAFYTKVMQATASPQLMIFSQDGSTTDYQGMRYGLCSALLGNAYYFYDQGGGGKQNYGTYIAFDEFNSNLGAALVGPLVFPGAKAWQKGVYRRDFEDGIALSGKPQRQRHSDRHFGNELQTHQRNAGPCRQQRGNRDPGHAARARRVDPAAPGAEINSGTQRASAHRALTNTP